MRLQLDADLSSIRGLLGVPNTRGDGTKGKGKDLGQQDVLSSSVQEPLVDTPGPEGDDDDQEEDDEEVGSESEDEQDSESEGSEDLSEEGTSETAAESSTRPKTDRSVGPVSLTFVKPPNDGAAVDRSLLASLLGKDSTADADEDDVLADLEKAQPSNKRKRRTEDDDVAEADTDDPYDRFVRELAFEKRAAPSDRLKSGIELAHQAAQDLQKHEQDRLKRMRGQEVEGDDAEEDDFANSRDRKAKKGKQRAPEGDDLEDGFELDGDEVNGFGLGGGLQVDGQAEEDESDGEDLIAPDEDSEDDEESRAGSEDGSDTGSEKDENEMLADLLHPDDEESDAGDDDGRGQSSLISRTASTEPAKSAKRAPAQSKELPYTFPCPASHGEFLEVLDGTSTEDLPVIIQRIRTLFHPSLAEGNKQKLAVSDHIPARSYS